MYANVATGLSASIAVPDEIVGGMQMLNDMIIHWRARAEAAGAIELIREIDSKAVRWWVRANDDAHFKGNFESARRSIGVGISAMHDLSKQVMQAEQTKVFSPAITHEIQRLERGSSVMEQVKQTLMAPTAFVSESVAGAVEAVSPELAAVARGSRWIVPALVAGGAFLFLSRRR